MLRVKVLEHDGLVGAERLELLIRRRRVEERGIESLRERPRGPPVRRPPGGRAVHLRGALAPGRRDGAEPDRTEPVAAAAEHRAHGLEVGQHRVAARVLDVEPHAHGVRRLGAPRGALVAKAHPAPRHALAERAVRTESAIGADLDRFVEGPDAEPRHERAHRRGRVRAADEEHVRARLEGHEIRRGGEAPGRVVVPVGVVLVRLVLLRRERRFAGAQRECGLADDGEGGRAVREEPAELGCAERP